MFATLLGGLPRPPLPDDATADQLVAAAVGAQVEAGLEPVIDAGWWGDETPGTVLERWQATAALTDRAVKAVVPGPWSVTRRSAPGADPGSLERDLAAAADASNAILRNLAAVRCPLVEVHEPGAATLGSDPAAHALFASTQRRLLDGIEGIHASLAITGGSAEDAGITTLLAAPYASLAFDLVRGPDNWRLAAAAPRTTGIVCGALTAEATGEEGIEILLYALYYAASTGGRGADRVGVATAGSMAGIEWAVAERRMQQLGKAVRLAAASPEERAAAVDPRAISIRGAALGRAGIRRAGRPRGSRPAT